MMDGSLKPGAKVRLFSELCKFSFDFLQFNSNLWQNLSNLY